MAINLLEHVVYVESVGMEMIPASVVRRYIEEQKEEMIQHTSTVKAIEETVESIGKTLNELNNSINE